MSHDIQKRVEEHIFIWVVHKLSKVESNDIIVLVGERSFHYLVRGEAGILK